VGFFGNVIVLGWPGAFALAGTVPFDVASSYTLSVVPLFILMGEVASESKLSGELFQAARVILSGFRGGLAVATLSASALFGAVSGSSLANAATMTRMALPELRKAGYDDGLATGCIAAGGSTDILIPPSIIPGHLRRHRRAVGPKLLAAGLIPGLVLTGLYIAVALAMVHIRPDYAPDPRTIRCASAIAALREPWQFVALFVGHHRRHLRRRLQPDRGGLDRRLRCHSAGHARPPHDHARFVARDRELGGGERAVVRHHHGRQPVSSFMVQTHLPELLLEGARAFNLSGLTVLVLIILGYIVLGCFLEGIGMVLITVPVFQPIITKFGYDPIWFAIIVVVMVEVGLIHPPVG
jgi:TRAP-type C4-dicarboxylate transport system permease large subunit